MSNVRKFWRGFSTALVFWAVIGVEMVNGMSFGVAILLTVAVMAMLWLIGRAAPR